jgi:H(+)-translocating pyrophosphatase
MDHSSIVTLLTWFVPVAGLIGVGFAVYMMRDVLGRDTGTPEMQEIASTIVEGAMAFLRRQYTTIAILAVVSAILVGILLAAIPASTQGTTVDNIPLGILTSVAFLLGAAASGVSGYIGMYVAVRANLRTASAARRSLGEALTVALRGGAVSGFLVVALSLLGVFIIYFAYAAFVGTPEGYSQAPFLIVGFGFGASFVALFAQLGGGIYTKAADVGADLVGKVEAGIPEDDPRNPAVIADLVGDNVGDCAGRGADLFESTAAAIGYPRLRSDRLPYRNPRGARFGPSRAGRDRPRRSCRAQQRLLHYGRGILRHDAGCKLDHASRDGHQRLAGGYLVRYRRHSRYPDVHCLRVHHTVLHRGFMEAGERDR